MKFKTAEIGCAFPECSCKKNFQTPKEGAAEMERFLREKNVRFYYEDDAR